MYREASGFRHGPCPSFLVCRLNRSSYDVARAIYAMPYCKANKACTLIPVVGRYRLTVSKLVDNIETRVESAPGFSA